VTKKRNQESPEEKTELEREEEISALKYVNRRFQERKTGQNTRRGFSARKKDGRAQIQGDGHRNQEGRGKRRKRLGYWSRTKGAGGGKTKSCAG